MMTASDAKPPSGLVTIQAQPPQAEGREYWRSLKEWAGGEEFQQLLHDEFPSHYWDGPDSSTLLDRREFWKLAGASLALACLSGCTRQPTEKIVPYVEAP